MRGFVLWGFGEEREYRRRSMFLGRVVGSENLTSCVQTGHRITAEERDGGRGS